jgi:uncharacterized membrane protein YhhN
VTTAAGVFLAVAAVAAVANWVAVARGAKAVEYVAKPATLAALVAVALALDPQDGTVRTWFVVALVASLAGDVFLMLPRDLFVAGLGSFLVAHLAYTGGLAVAGIDAAWLALGAVAVAVAVAGIAPPLVRGVRRRAPELAVPVMAYMVVISAMVAAAIGTGDGVAAIGAVLFYASDALIGLTRFVRSHPRGDLAVMVTYHLGQALLVLSLV